MAAVEPKQMPTKLSDWRMLDLAIRLAVIIGMLVGIATYISWTNSPEIRYRKYYNRMYSIIYGQQGDVDVAAMGSSRAQTMFGAQYWAKELFGDDALDHVVYNLATSQRGKGFHYTVIRDLLEQHKVKKVLLDVIDTDQKMPFHPWFYIVATHGDLWRSFVLDKGQSFHNRVKSHLQILLKKHSSIIEDWAAGRLLAAPKRATPLPVATTTDHLTANPIRPAMIEAMSKNVEWDKIEAGKFSWNLDAGNELRNSRYLTEIVELVRSKGATIDFFYVPQLYQPLVGVAMKEQLEQRYGVRLLQPPRDRLREFYPKAFADFGHGSEQGRAIFARLVVDALKARWAGAGKP